MHSGVLHFYPPFPLEDLKALYIPVSLPSQTLQWVDNTPALQMARWKLEEAKEPEFKITQRVFGRMGNRNQVTLHVVLHFIHSPGALTSLYSMNLIITVWDMQLLVIIHYLFELKTHRQMEIQ